MSINTLLDRQWPAVETACQARRVERSSVPNSDRSSTLPVPGAEQLIASGAIDGLRPVISASGAYRSVPQTRAVLVRTREEQVPQSATAGLELAAPR